MAQARPHSRARQPRVPLAPKRRRRRPRRRPAREGLPHLPGDLESPGPNAGRGRGSNPPDAGGEYALHASYRVRGSFGLVAKEWEVAEARTKGARSKAASAGASSKSATAK